MKRYLACGAVILALGGCVNDPYHQRQNSGATIGAVSGGVLGGLVGSAAGGTGSTILGVGIGALAGGLIGGAIGRDLDQRDREYMDQRAQYALEQGVSGQQYDWRNPDNDHYGYVVPQRAYQTSSGPCREFTTRVYVGGRSEEAYGTACRQPDGSWRIAENAPGPRGPRYAYPEPPPPAYGYPRPYYN